MGRRFRKFRERMQEHRARLKDPETKQRVLDTIGDDKPKILTADIIMISGCEDSQTSADVSNVNSFQLPDPAGRAGGACTSTLLNILYKDEQKTEEDLSFVEVLSNMRTNLEEQGFTQIPQLTSTTELDLSHKFDLVPDNFEGTARAVMIGINYVGQEGELRGCHNDVLNMKKYLMEVHGFEEDNITVLMDDGEHEIPSLDNMMSAYKKIIEESEAGDSIFLHYSGHGSKVRDDDANEEEDGYDEVLVPVDYQESGMLRDDDLNQVIVQDLSEGVHVVSLMDCCHSGTILDLPYKFQPNGDFEGLELDEDFDWGKVSSVVSDLMGSLFG